MTVLPPRWRVPVRGKTCITHDGAQIQKFLPSFAGSVPLALDRAERHTLLLDRFQLIGPPFIIMCVFITAVPGTKKGHYDVSSMLPARVEISDEIGIHPQPIEFHVFNLDILSAIVIYAQIHGPN